jgi:hypothetical protein
MGEQRRSPGTKVLKTGLSIIAICAIGLFASQMECAARGSSSNERPWAPEHIDNLPPDIRRAVTAREATCGNKAAAAHYFSVSIVAGGLRFTSLHFEDFACFNRASVCNAQGCLHEVYLESRGRHRLVFNAHARDLKMTDGTAAGIEVNQGTSNQFFRWNGSRFVPASATLPAR